MNQSRSWSIEAGHVAESASFLRGMVCTAGACSPFCFRRASNNVRCSGVKAEIRSDMSFIPASSVVFVQLVQVMQVLKHRIGFNAEINEASRLVNSGCQQLLDDARAFRGATHQGTGFKILLEGGAHD